MPAATVTTILLELILAAVVLAGVCYGAKKEWPD